MGLSIGINFVLWSFVGFFAGSKLDEKLGTDPWLMLVGILLGIGFAFYATIKEILVLEETDEEE